MALKNWGEVGSSCFSEYYVALPSRVVPKCALCVVFDQPRRRIPAKSVYCNAGSCQISLLANPLLKLTRFSGDQHNRPRKSQWNSQDPVDRECYFKSICCGLTLFTLKNLGNLEDDAQDRKKSNLGHIRCKPISKGTSVTYDTTL